MVRQLPLLLAGRWTLPVAAGPSSVLPALAGRTSLLHVQQ